MRSRDGKYSVRKNSYGGYTIRFYTDEGKRKSRNFRSVTERDNFTRDIRRMEDLSSWFPDDRDSRFSFSGNVREVAGEWIRNGRLVRQISESCLGNYRAQMDLHILPVIGEVRW